MKREMVAISGRESELPFDTTLIRGILEHWHGVPGNLMPILHEIQDLFGYIPPESVPHIARALNQSRAEVHGVISFYHDFRTAPAGRQVIKICQAESCQAMGSRSLTTDLEVELGCSLGETTPDGGVTLQPVYCLGLCACSPAVMIDDTPVGRATLDAVKQCLTPKREEA
ncbi:MULTISPECIES: formate dehydrogenase subunit gamma [unclassified Thioalkalivibrio]|uniref:formate dehydrogenase subunit gamma n=1 Tax=unclassified Thioalkalivibrio TaxID=2621013 RepID=UPI001E2D029F|nr:MULTISPECIES: formate dehydrogenase subunit gamma [unclassified Thioalkalivibrio]